MRGREHGIPSYNKWRVFCGVNAANTFEELREQILEASVRRGLANNYNSPGTNFIFYNKKLLNYKLF